MTTALVDGDIIVYSVGFASDNRYYVVGETAFKSKKDIPEELRDKAELVVEPEPLEYCLHSVKKVLEKIKERTGCTNLVVYLSGEGNFRNEIAITHKYKGNRDSAHKPTWYREIRTYLIEKHWAHVTIDMEADDAIGRHSSCFIAEGGEYTICTLDKDLDQLPGKHYNWRKDIMYDVLPQEAVHNYFMQVLTGDDTDNIKGPKGIGPKTAAKLIEWCRTWNEYYKVCLDAYCLNEKRLAENMRLLWILRE